jgi:hypothetical protein
MLLLGSCASRLPKLDYAKLEAPPSPEVVELWESRREVVVRAIREEKFTLRDFDEAVRFFERITGLPGQVISTPYGPLPAKSLPRDLAAWDDWFRVHGTELTAADLR